jgi:hypothetical protein
MFISWTSRYESRAGKSKRLSQIGAFVILVMVLVEAVDLFRRASQAENLSWDSAFYGPSGIIVLTIVFLGFGVRLLALAWKPSSFLFRSLSWWIVVGTYWLSDEFSGRDSRMIYDLFHTFPLQVAGMFYVLVGSLRFLYFASISFKNDLDFNS